jgi:hypothetical protein
VQVTKVLVRRADHVQRERSPLAVALATIKKFGEDRAGQLAALIAYYGFFSLFPLMLAFVTILGLVLEEDSSFRQGLVDSALSQFPVIGDQIKTNVNSLQGSGLALALGVGGALWAGLGGIKAAQNAMDQVWDVPVKRQPSFPIAVEDVSWSDVWPGAVLAAVLDDPAAARRLHHRTPARVGHADVRLLRGGDRAAQLAVPRGPGNSPRRRAERRPCA